MNKRLLVLTAFAYCLALTGAVGCQQGAQGGSGGGCGGGQQQMQDKPNCGPGTHQEGSVCVADKPPK